MSWLDGIGNMFDSFLNPQKGYQKGQDQLNKYYRDAQGNLQPYNANGQSAYGDYSGAMKRLLDPAALEAEWTKGYSESPSAKNAERNGARTWIGCSKWFGSDGFQYRVECDSRWYDPNRIR